MLYRTSRAFTSISNTVIHFSRFSASSKSARSKFQASGAVASPSAAAPALIDLFIKRAASRQTEVSDALLRRGWACVDNLLGDEACNAMRGEADALMKVM
jgi:hypothetical protein